MDSTRNYPTQTQETFEAYVTFYEFSKVLLIEIKAASNKFYIILFSETVKNGKVLDLVYLKQDVTLKVKQSPVYLPPTIISFSAPCPLSLCVHPP